MERIIIFAASIFFLSCGGNAPTFSKEETVTIESVLTNEKEMVRQYRGKKVAMSGYILLWQNGIWVSPTGEEKEVNSEIFLSPVPPPNPPSFDADFTNIIYVLLNQRFTDEKMTQFYLDRKKVTVYGVVNDDSEEFEILNAEIFQGN